MDQNRRGRVPTAVIMTEAMMPPRRETGKIPSSVAKRVNIEAVQHPRFLSFRRYRNRFGTPWQSAIYSV